MRVLKSPLQIQQMRSVCLRGWTSSPHSLHWQRSLILAGDVETPEEKTDSMPGVLGQARSRADVAQAAGAAGLGPPGGRWETAVRCPCF